MHNILQIGKIKIPYVQLFDKYTAIVLYHTLTSRRAVVVEEIRIEIVGAVDELKVADGSDVIEEVEYAEEGKQKDEEGEP